MVAHCALLIAVLPSRFKVAAQRYRTKYLGLGPMSAGIESGTRSCPTCCSQSQTREQRHAGVALQACCEGARRRWSPGIFDERQREFQRARSLSLWRNTLDRFDGIKIGLSATPPSRTMAYFAKLVYR